ncbi:MAG: DUF2283 domain-containing protein [Proteobacteria bacterium]|nr:DUF2283 domain-containing protein [Pseudomonadota bacterium]
MGYAGYPGYPGADPEDPPVDAIEEPGGVIVSYGEDKEPVSVEFLNASLRKLIEPGEVSVTLQPRE